MRPVPFLLAAAVFCAVPFAAFAQNDCTPLEVVGFETGQLQGATLTSKGTRVEKSISPPGLLVSDNNWNTDFAVPSGTGFRRYVLQIVPDSDGQYNIRFAFKYPDNTDQTVYKQNARSLGKNKAFTVSGQPRGGQQPYQVNVLFGHELSTGKSYTAQVLGCR